VAGRVISGSQRWLHLGPVNFQPSELAKLTLILALAKYFNDERDLPARGYTLLGLAKPSSILYPVGAAGGLLLFWEHLPLAVSLRLVLLGGCLVWGTASFLVAIRSGRTGLHDLLSPVILLALPSVLILRQPDLGTTLVLAAIAGTMALFVKIRWTSLLLAVVIAVSAATSAWFFLLEDYQNDAGRVINPQMAEGQVEGAVPQSLGMALSEHMVFDEHGVALNTDFDRYHIYTALDMPELTVRFAESHESSGPFGAKAVGEIPINAPAPAVINAIYNACGVRLRSVPVSPEAILRALRPEDR